MQKPCTAASSATTHRLVCADCLVVLPFLVDQIEILIAQLVPLHLLFDLPILHLVGQRNHVAISITRSLCARGSGGGGGGGRRAAMWRPVKLESGGKPLMYPDKLDRTPRN